MKSIKAVLFDFGGTLYDYKTLESAERESLVDLLRWSGFDCEPFETHRIYRNALRRVFRKYLNRRFYMHSDFFQEALVGMLEEFGTHLRAEYFERYRDLVWRRHAHDLILREGVYETLTELKKRNLYLGVVSNIDEDQLAHMVKITKIEPYFDSLLSSEFARSCKPDTGIFNEAIHRAGCRPEEALFIGDSIAQDVAGANRAGLLSVLLWHRKDRKPPLEEHHPFHIIQRIPDVLLLV
jgi:HAD superfamily hydrolase (TIGR01509 family)